MRHIITEIDVSIHGYDAQDEFSSDGSDRMSIHKHYKKKLNDMRKYSSSEDEDGDDDCSCVVQDVHAEIHDGDSFNTENVNEGTLL